MRHHFSGITSNKELSMLQGLPDILLTPSQVDKIGPGRLLEDIFADHPRRTVMLDNGAYELWRNGQQIIDPRDFYTWLAQKPYWLINRLDRIVFPDHFTDAQATYTWWFSFLKLNRRGPISGLRNIFAPAWHWETGYQRYLNYYLDTSEIVCISGAAKALRGPHREKDPERKKELTELRKRARATVIELCEKYPQRFHVLGCNDLHTLDAIKHTAYSVDTSKWLDGARYGYAIFRNTRTGKLSQAPAKRIQGWETLDREGRCTGCAWTLYKELDNTVPFDLSPQNTQEVIA